MARLDIEQEALNIIKDEKSEWQDANYFVTETVAFQMREVIKKCRKNYWGIFDKTKDEQTSKQKIWIPLTESTVEAVVKNIDMDTKDLNFRSKTPSQTEFTRIVKYKVREFLDKSRFGEALDQLERQLAIDGTVVWKTYTDNGEIKRKTVDLLNFYIDPAAESIQETGAVIERAIISEKEFEDMDWINKDKAIKSEVLHKNDDNLEGNSGSTKYVEVFERWGLMPEYLITGKKKDTKLIDGHIVATKNAVHLIERNNKKIKPYEECWYSKVAGRWYGRGVGEKLLWLQLYINTVVNIRITRATVSQLGLFKIKKGAGVTPQMLAKLAVNGAITVNQMDDIDQFVMQEASQASYTDENNIQTWSQRVTGAFDMATGEEMPSTTTATVGSIQARNAQTMFTFIKEEIGMFLERWIDNHVLPNLKLKKGDIVRIYGGDQEDIKFFNEKLTTYLTAIQKQNGDERDTSDISAGISDELYKQKHMFWEIGTDIPLNDFETKVYITNEEFDKGVMVSNIVQMLPVAPEYREQLIMSMSDLMGLDLKPVAAPALASGMGQPQGKPVTDQYQQTQEANTM